MIHIVTGIDEINIENWSLFVYNHPDGNVFQSPDYYRAINNTNLNKCYSFFALEDGEIAGVLVASVMKEEGLFLEAFSSRSIISGGPIVRGNDPLLAKSLIDCFDSFIRRKVIYSQFRNLFGTDSYKLLFLKNGYTFEDHLNIIINLDINEDDLWKQVHSKRRNEIRRSKKEGIFVEFVDTRSSVELTYPILMEVYNRAKLPLPSIDYFKTILHELGPGIFRVFAAKSGDTIIGTMYTLCYKNTIYDWYAGSYAGYYSKYPNDLIPWEVLVWGKKNGYKQFDFGGAGNPNKPYGVRDYKRKFGGNLVAFGRYEKIFKPTAYKISKAGFSIWKLIRYLGLKC